MPLGKQLDFKEWGTRLRDSWIEFQTTWIPSPRHESIFRKIVDETLITRARLRPDRELELLNILSTTDKCNFSISLPRSPGFSLHSMSLSLQQRKNSLKGYKKPKGKSGRYVPGELMGCTSIDRILGPGSLHIFRRLAWEHVFCVPGGAYKQGWQG